MIVDNLKYGDVYKNTHPLIAKALDIAKTLNADTPEGDYPIDDGFRYSVTTLVPLPKDQKDFEAHREFIDVHVVISGVELAGVCDLDDCTEKAPFNKESDFGAYTCDKSNFFTITEGMFYIVFFHDAHMPNVLHSTDTIKKAVFKIKL